jgi:hypothetical protein
MLGSLNIFPLIFENKNVFLFLNKKITWGFLNPTTLIMLNFLTTVKKG